MLCTKLFTGRCVLHISISRIIRVHFESVKRIIHISAPAAIDAFLTQIGFLFFAKIVALSARYVFMSPFLTFSVLHLGGAWQVCGLVPPWTGFAVPSPFTSFIEGEDGRELKYRTQI